MKQTNTISPSEAERNDSGDYRTTGHGARTASLSANESMSQSAKSQFTTIHRLDEIPPFADEGEEHAFWATHELSDALWDEAEPLSPDELPAPAAATPVVIRLDQGTLKRAKALARPRRMSYQALLEEILTTRLAEASR